MIDKLCDMLLAEGHEVCSFTIESKDLNAIIPLDKIDRIPFERIRKPRENYGKIFEGIFGELVSIIGNNFEALLRFSSIVERAAYFAKTNQVEMIWCIVQGQTMIKTIRPLAKKADLPYVIQIWDPPTWWLRENKFDRFTTRAVLREYGRAVHESTCCITASKCMNDEYMARYNPPRAVPVVLGFDSSRVLADCKDPNSFVIAVCGQLYASTEILALIAALNLLEWKCTGKRIVFKLFSQYFGVTQHIAFASPVNIHLRGWLPQNELLRELASADLLYCPYWFDDLFREEASLAFPSKLSTYLKTAVPVMVHAPEYASPRKFVEEFNAAYVCGSLESKIIADTLRGIINDPEIDKVGERGFIAFTEHLTTDVMRSSFFSALSI